MARGQNRPTTPDQRIRDLRKEFRAFDGEEPGPDRAARLAAFARAAHEERQLNMVMHAATLCLEDDPDAPGLLVDAYLSAGRDTEERLHALDDLRDLARYVDRDDIAAIAEEHLRSEARRWVIDGDDAERRHRLRRVQSLVSQEVADAIRDELELPT